MPNKSSLTGQSAKALADAYTASTGNQWVQSIGSTYSLFEVAKEAFTVGQRPARQGGCRRRHAHGELHRDVRPDRLRLRPGAWRGHHQARRRAVEARHRKYPFEMVGGGQLAEPEPCRSAGRLCPPMHELSMPEAADV